MLPKIFILIAGWDEDLDVLGRLEGNGSVLDKTREDVGLAGATLKLVGGVLG